MGETGNSHTILVERCEGKMPLGTPRCRWEDYIRKALRETGWEGVDWTHLAHVNTVMNLRVP
jgi:hypothetical protein